MQTDAIKEKYEPRILALMAAIRERIEAETDWRGCEPFDMTDEEYRWDMTFNRNGNRDDGVDVAFTIVESDVREGSEDGIAFMLEFTGYGGRMLGSMSPYNYTEELWVPLEDTDGIEARFAMFECLDLDEAVNTFAQVDL